MPENFSRCKRIVSILIAAVLALLLCSCKSGSKQIKKDELIGYWSTVEPDPYKLIKYNDDDTYTCTFAKKGKFGVNPKDGSVTMIDDHVKIVRLQPVRENEEWVLIYTDPYGQEYKFAHEFREEPKEEEVVSDKSEYGLLHQKMMSLLTSASWSDAENNQLIFTTTTITDKNGKSVNYTISSVESDGDDLSCVVETDNGKSGTIVITAIYNIGSGYYKKDQNIKLAPNNYDIIIDIPELILFYGSSNGPVRW